MRPPKGGASLRRRARGGGGGGGERGRGRPPTSPADGGAGKIFPFFHGEKPQVGKSGVPSFFQRGIDGGGRKGILALYIFLFLNFSTI